MNAKASELETEMMSVHTLRSSGSLICETCGERSYSPFTGTVCKTSHLMRLLTAGFKININQSEEQKLKWKLEPSEVWEDVKQNICHQHPVYEYIPAAGRQS